LLFLSNLHDTNATDAQMRRADARSYVKNLDIM